ncbi:MAG: hypothetical protein GY694_14810, partial [Gammaproteobacteria bacterium]|nr:hypothetical protein [Gammaproteobacteria bacterium]
DSQIWHGPATVLGKDAQNYLLKHGGVYVRVHPCRLQPIVEHHSDPSQISEDNYQPRLQQESQNNSEHLSDYENDWIQSYSEEPKESAERIPQTLKKTAPWSDMNVCEEQPDTGQQPRLTRRWFSTEKLMDNLANSWTKEGASASLLLQTLTRDLCFNESKGYFV